MVSSDTSNRPATNTSLQEGLKTLQDNLNLLEAVNKLALDWDRFITWYRAHVYEPGPFSDERNEIPDEFKQMMTHLGQTLPPSVSEEDVARVINYIEQAQMEHKLGVTAAEVAGRYWIRPDDTPDEEKVSVIFKKLHAVHKFKFILIMDQLLTLRDKFFAEVLKGMSVSIKTEIRTRLEVAQGKPDNVLLSLLEQAVDDTVAREFKLNRPEGTGYDDELIDALITLLGSPR